MVIDALDFAYNGIGGSRVLNGHGLTSEFKRLCQDLPEPQNGTIDWEISGDFDANTGFVWLDVKAKGSVLLECQRCLQAFEYPLLIANRLRLLANEAQLKSMEALESEGDGVDYEYIVASHNLNVLHLIEDELILVLPFAPKHDVCPSADNDKTINDIAETSPFAVLKQLKKH